MSELGEGIDEMDSYLKLLHQFASLPVTSKSKSIFDIAGYSHYENVSSNILAFYLDPNNEHGLGDLLLSSLMDLVNGNENLAGENESYQDNIQSYQDNIQIDREVSTDKGGRIDIVIETGNQIVGIENKIFHHLNNDLADYSATLDKRAKQNELRVVKIILSIKREQESSGFVCVTYDAFWSQIRKQLGDYISPSSQKWLLYLVDFMSSIEELNGGKNMEIDENDQFFIENEELINKLIKGREQFSTKLNDRVKSLGEKLKKTGKPVEYRRRIYNGSFGSCLVHDFNLSDHSIALDLYIFPKGWELTLFGRNKSSQSYLSGLFSISPLSEHKADWKIRASDSRYILRLRQCDLKTNLDEIEKQLREWIGLLLQSERNKNTSKAINSDS